MMNKRTRLIAILLLCISLILVASCTNDYALVDTPDTTTVVDGISDCEIDDFQLKEDYVIYLNKSYKIIEVDGGDLSAVRQANVAVDIGFGSRVYIGLTNEFNQLFAAFATEIILQNDETEPVIPNIGRYYYDEAQISGTEKKNLDCGHVIADSCGGVSNAYNITPQDSTVNRTGDQAKMEKAIRNAGGCSNFVAIITYPDTVTQIPMHYNYSYYIDDIKYNVEFDNGDNIGSDNAGIQIEEIEAEEKVFIEELDKVLEYITIKNNSPDSIDLEGWKIVSVRGNQTYVFNGYVLESGECVTIGDDRRSDVNLTWMEGRGIWNNSESDPAQLFNTSGILIDEFYN